jgi:carbamoyltransferase
MAFFGKRKQDSHNCTLWLKCDIINSMSKEMSKKNDYILGVHYGHDSTVVLMKNGKIIEAMSEERLSRQKKHVGFPHLALAYIEKKYGIQKHAHVCIVGENQDHNGTAFITLEENAYWRNPANAPKGKWFLRAVGVKFPFIGFLYDVRARMLGLFSFSKKRDARDFFNERFPGAKIEYIHHHLAHAYATIPFYPDHKKRLIFTLDGSGDDCSGSINLYENGSIKQLHTIPVNDSLGLLYSAFVGILGMSRNEHEFKVMGLAPYAKKSAGDKVYEKLKDILYFDKEKMSVVSKIPVDKVYGTYGIYYLLANDFLQHRFDSLAYGIQKLAEEVIMTMITTSIEKYHCRDIAVGGGVFMNVKANQRVNELAVVDSLIVAPSCGDESLAIGAAVYMQLLLNNHDVDTLAPVTDLYLGSEYSDNEIKAAIDEYAFSKECIVTYFNPSSDSRIEKRVAELLSDNHVVGRLKGRAEWGARALGNRSILANPSSRDNVKLINEMIKGRDFWMPFATSMLFERVSDYLVHTKNLFAPYMSITFDTKPLAYNDLIAALHPYDLTSRPQMVTRDMNEDYHTLIFEYQKITGKGGILNTSFNLHGEPNVESPIDALRTFEHSGLPFLALGNFLLEKKVKNKVE